MDWTRVFAPRRVRVRPQFGDCDTSDSCCTRGHLKASRICALIRCVETVLNDIPEDMAALRTAFLAMRSRAAALEIDNARLAAENTFLDTLNQKLALLCRQAEAADLRPELGESSIRNSCSWRLRIWSRRSARSRPRRRRPRPSR